MPNRFWVGGSGNWNNTANWAATSGGAGGQSVPGVGDVAYLDAASGAATVTLTQDVTLTWLFTAGFTGTLNFSTFKFVLTGNGTAVFTASSAATYTGLKRIELSYAGSVGTRTITAVGVSEANALDFVVTAGADVCGPGSSAVVRNWTYGPAFTGSMAGSAATIMGDLTLSASMTVTASANALTFASTNTTERLITTNGRTVDRTLIFNGIGGTWRFVDALTQGVTRSVALTNGTLLLKEGVTSTFGGLSATGPNQRSFRSALAGTPATLSIASGTLGLFNTVITDITATGGATFNAFTTNGNVDGGGNSGWDFWLQIGRSIYTRRKNRRVLL